MTFAATWMDLEVIILSKVNQKDRYDMILVICGILNGPQEGSITANHASGADGIPVELFQILKDNALKCCPQYASKFEKLNRCCRTGKGQFSFQFQRKAMTKNAQATTQLHSSHILAK